MNMEKELKEVINNLGLIYNLDEAFVEIKRLIALEDQEKKKVAMSDADVVHFVGDVVYRLANPEGKMDTPSAVYESMERKLAKWKSEHKKP